MKTALLGLENSGSQEFYEILNHGQKFIPGKKNIGLANVPDNRVGELSSAFQPKKTIYASLQFSYLQIVPAIPFEELRTMDVLVYILRAYPLYEGEKIDPVKTYNDFLTDLKIRDMDLLDRFCTRNAKDLSKKKELQWAEQIQAYIENDQNLETLGEQVVLWAKNLGLVSKIPRFAVLNSDENDWKNDSLIQRMKSTFPEDDFLQLCLSIEKDISELDPENRAEMLELYQIKEPALSFFLRKLYDFLGWMTFFTVGEDEVRAWTIKKGSNAFDAAGKIHSDIQHGFIRAEVVHYDDFKKNEFSFKLCKESGCFAVEGKNYLVQDGDIVHFRFNI